jgi:hypothetical protein
MNHAHVYVRPSTLIYAPTLAPGQQRQPLKHNLNAQMRDDTRTTAGDGLAARAKNILILNNMNSSIGEYV